MTSELSDAEGSLRCSGKGRKGCISCAGGTAGRTGILRPWPWQAAADQIWIFHPPGLPDEGIPDGQAEKPGEKGVKLSTFQIKNQYGYLESDQTERFFDVLIAAYLLNPLKNDYSIEDIANEQLGLMIQSRQQLWKSFLWRRRPRRGRRPSGNMQALLYIRFSWRSPGCGKNSGKPGWRSF